MPSVNLHSTAISHPKIAVLSDGAFRLWIAGLSYCQNHLTDGFIPKHGINSLGVKVAGKWIDELLAMNVPGKSSLWHAREEGYDVHDYLGWNDAASDVQIRRTNLRERVRKHRNRKPVSNGVGNALPNAQAGPVSNDPIKTTERRPETTEHDRGVVGIVGAATFQRRRHPLDEGSDRLVDPETCERAERFETVFAAIHADLCRARYVSNHERDWPHALRLATQFSDREFEALLRVYLLATGPHFDGKPRTLGRMAEAAPMIEQQMRRDGRWPNAA